MNRLPPWTAVAIGVVLFLFALLGITNSVHASARVVYAALIVVSIIVTVMGIRRPGVAHPPRKPADPRPEQPRGDQAHSGSPVDTGG